MGLPAAIALALIFVGAGTAIIATCRFGEWSTEGSRFIAAVVGVTAAFGVFVAAVQTLPQ